MCLSDYILSLVIGMTVGSLLGISLASLSLIRDDRIRMNSMEKRLEKLERNN